jgi:sirohydrochlorin ferrochelatase
VIGHGTKHDPASRGTTLAQANALRESNLVGEVVDVYLDDDPAIPDAYQMIKSPTLIAVPFFLAPGSHTTSDVPTALGLRSGQTRGLIQGREVYYTPAVGTDESICELILELARDAGMNFQPHRAGSIWNTFPAAGRAELIEAVQARQTMQFGQLLLSPTCVKPADTLEPTRIIDTPFVLRQYLREQPFRPLSTSTDLPGGWSISIQYPEMLHAAVETVYPGMVADWSAHRNGTFVTSTLQDTIERQTGMHRKLSNLTTSQSAQVVESVCGHCVRHPTWHHEAPSPNVIPCPEPCNYWMSRAQEYVS